MLTLFGKYAGALKDNGFYFVNPFRAAANPAAKTKPNQSGDGDNQKKRLIITASGASGSGETALASKKLSLKATTLNNSRRKLNDCLGSPVEIGIAVIRRVVDAAKAVFEVDNYKEYLSPRRDGALRNIVRLYPYDVAPDVDTTGDGASGIEAIDTYPAYATEIAAVMLRRRGHGRNGP